MHDDPCVVITFSIAFDITFVLAVLYCSLRVCHRRTIHDSVPYLTRVSTSFSCETYRAECAVHRCDFSMVARTRSNCFCQTYEASRLMAYSIERAVLRGRESLGGLRGLSRCTVFEVDGIPWRVVLCASVPRCV